jgi:hypothetical protein
VGEVTLVDPPLRDEIDGGEHGNGGDHRYPIEGNFQPRECEHQHYGLRQHFDPAQRDQPPQRIRRGRKNKRVRASDGPETCAAALPDSDRSAEFYALCVAVMRAAAIGRASS